MNKKVVFIISVIVNIILAIVLVVAVTGAAAALKFNYVEEDTLTPDIIRSNLERENYGVAAVFSHTVRGGEVVADEYKDYYMLGEYADMIFLKEIFVKAGNAQMADNCAKRIDEIRKEMPDYTGIFDKIDWSEKNALAK